MTSQTNKNAHHVPPANNDYEKVRLWMTDDEIKYFSVKENRFGILLSLILLRYKAIRRHIASLAEIADGEWKEHLLRIDKICKYIISFVNRLWISLVTTRCVI